MREYIRPRDGVDYDAECDRCGASNAGNRIFSEDGGMVGAICSDCAMAWEVEQAAAILGRKGGKIGGKSTSPAKQAAVRENGRKGGRPKNWYSVELHTDGGVELVGEVLGYKEAIWVAKDRRSGLPGDEKIVIRRGRWDD